MREFNKKQICVPENTAMEVGRAEVFAWKSATAHSRLADSGYSGIINRHGTNEDFSQIGDIE